MDPEVEAVVEPLADGAPPPGNEEEAPGPPPPGDEALAEDEAPGPDKSVVDLLGDDVPEWLKEFDGAGKPYKVSREEIDTIFRDHPKAAQLISNLRQVANAATRAAAADRKALAVASAKVAAQGREFKAEREKLWKVFADPKIRDAIKPPEGEAPDEFTPEGRKWHARNEFSERMGKFFEALDARIKQDSDAFQTEEQGRVALARRDEIAAFAAEHDDFVAFIPYVKQLQDQYGGPAKMPAEEAYYIAQGKVARGTWEAPAKARARAENAPKDQPKPEALARRSARAAMPGAKAGASPPETSPPLGLTSMEIAQWYEEHPEVLEANTKTIARTGRLR